MAIVRVPRLAIQPQFPQIDRGNLLGAGVNIALMQVGGRLIDVANPGVVWTPSGGAASSIVTSSVGPVRASALNGTNAYWSATGYGAYSGAGTIFAWFPRLGAPSNYGLMLLCTASNYSYLSTVSNNQAIAFTTTIPGVGLSSIYNTRNTSLVMSTARARSNFWFNGRFITYAAGVNSGFAAGSKTMQVGAYPSSTDYNVDGDAAIIGWSSKAWDDAEAAAFHANPWQMFQAPPRRLWAVGAAPSVPTLSSATYVPGSITSSGFRPRVTAS